MKRVFLLSLSLLIFFGTSACSAKTQASESGVSDTKSAGLTDGSGTTEAKGIDEETTLSSENETGTSKRSKREQCAEFQQSIPEEYRLKLNVSADWNAPLPSAEQAGDFALFGLDKKVNKEGGDTRKSAGLPKVIDLFTLEELGAYFDMGVSVVEKQGMQMENEDVENFLLKSTEQSKATFKKGKVTIYTSDWGDPATAAAAKAVFDAGDREISIPGVEKRVTISQFNSIKIPVTASATLSVSVEFTPLEGGPPQPAEEELVSDFARFVYERFMEKMK